MDTYGAWRTPEGILYESHGTGNGRAVLPVEDLPQMVTNYRRDGQAKHWGQDMVEWTMNWDEWAGARYESAKDWRARHHESKPYRPKPAFFVLNLDDFEVELPFTRQFFGCAFPIQDEDEEDDEE